MSEQVKIKEAELVERLRSIDAEAPRALHERVQALVEERAAEPARPRRTTRPRRGWAVAVPALGAVVVALALSLSGGGSTLTLGKTVALTLRAPTMAAPAEDPRDGSQLKVAVDGIRFPYWGGSFGFRATGERVDHVDGREVKTVFYAGAGKRWIGYAIVAGTPAPHVGGGIVSTHGGTVYRVLAQQGAQVVVWQRDGRLCVVAGHGVSRHTLLALASWHDGDGLAS